jgi:hypothetical protein
MTLIFQLVVAWFIINWLSYGWKAMSAIDDTDGQDGERSGFIVMKDHKTGVQYLATSMGGLTVRLTSEGKPYV